LPNDRNRSNRRTTRLLRSEIQLRAIRSVTPRHERKQTIDIFNKNGDKFDRISSYRPHALRFVIVHCQSTIHFVLSAQRFPWQHSVGVYILRVIAMGRITSVSSTVWHNYRRLFSALIRMTSRKLGWYISVILSSHRGTRRLSFNSFLRGECKLLSLIIYYRSYSLALTSIVSFLVFRFTPVYGTRFVLTPVYGISTR